MITFKKQAIANKVGEVYFRKKLVSQHLGENLYFRGQPTKPQIIQELAKRVQLTDKDFQDLIKRKILLSPFLEIGAEKCQRSIYLVNKLGLSGFAGDISFESLVSAEQFKHMLHYHTMPIRVCLDAYHLPFPDSSLQFVFFYETLHHFPHPLPILKEAYRVVRNGGYIFFGEEPVKQLLNLRLWRRDFCLNTFEKLLKYTLILPFLSTIGKSETDNDVLEETFWIDTWEESLNMFALAEAQLTPYKIGRSITFYKNNKHQSKWLDPPLLHKILLAVQGGGIKVLARVFKKETSCSEYNNLHNLLACPQCKINSQLKFTMKYIYCTNCKIKYPVKKGVYILLPKELSKKLYNFIFK